MTMRSRGEGFESAISVADPPIQWETPPAPSQRICPTELPAAGFEIGMALKSLRKANRLTQRELARKAGVARTTIAKLECGIFKSLAVSRLENIARALAIDFQTLLRKARSLGDAMSLRTQVNKVEFSLEYPEEGFRIASFVSRSQEFFFGRIEMHPQKTAPSAKLPHTPFVYIHVLEGKFVLTRFENSVVLKPGDCHMIPGSDEYELYNPDLLKPAHGLFITQPSFLVS